MIFILFLGNGIHTIKQEILFFYILFSIFILILIIVFIVSIIKKEKKYRALEKDKLIAEFTASEKERNRISTQLHNEIGPYLSGIKIRLDSIRAENNPHLEECKLVLDQCIGQIRSISKSLAPINPLGSSFEDDLRQYIYKTNIHNQLKINLQVRNKLSLSIDQNNHLYRILQEIILNTIKHANAETLRIQIFQEGDELNIKTADDGIGFDMEKIKNLNRFGLGLLGIISRVEIMNGTIYQSPDLDKGTRYYITIPILKNE